MRKVVARTTCLIGVLLTVLPLAVAQTVTTGEVTGISTDITGAIVPGASIIVKSVDTGESRTVLSNSEGFYRVTFLRPGAYDISASTTGMRSDFARAVVVLGQVSTVNLRLKVEESRQSVTVRDIAPMLETDNAQSIYTLSDRQLELLPLAGGDLAGVVASVPGVVIANHSSGSSGQFAIQGTGSLSNLFTLNGADEMDPYINTNNAGATGLMLGANEVQEASVVLNPYDGHYGRQAGAQVNLLSKSGANAFHGNIAYTYGGSVLNANDYFNKVYGLARPRLVSNQYAASFGGPIVRDKIFFFVDTEGLRYALPGTPSVISLPSPDLESYTLNTIQPSQAAFYKRAFALFDAAPGHERAVPVTNGTGPLQDRSNRLGCGTLKGVAAGGGKTFGVDASCAEAYAADIPSDTSEWLLAARVDYNVSSRQRMFLRLKADRGSRLINPSAISTVFNVYGNAPDNEAQLNHTFAITPRLTNNLSAGMSYYTYFDTFVHPAGAVNSFPFRFNFRNGGASRGGFAGLGPQAAFPSGWRTVNLQFIDDVSYTLGNHSLEAGLNYRYTRETDLQYSSQTIGRFTFQRLDEFAKGALNPNSGSAYFQRFPRTPVLHVRLNNAGFYAQDHWAATSRLMLTAALRFDFTANPECIEHCYSRMVGPFSDIPKGASIPYNQTIQAGLDHPYAGMGAPVAQPRVGFAWSPSWSRETVIRGGIGVFADLYPAEFANDIAGNPPNLFSPNILGALVNDGGPGSAPAVAAASAAAFQNGFASGATLSQLQAAVAPATFSAGFFTATPREVRTPRYVEWSLEVQRQLGKRNLASVRYAGNTGYDLFVLNFGLNAAANRNNFPNGFGGLPTSIPDPRFSIVDQLTNGGSSNYNGLTFSFHRSITSGLQGQISYTWSHALDSVSNGGLYTFAFDSVRGQINPANLRSLNYGNSDYDVRHNLTLDFVWDLPLHTGRNALRSIIGGWSLASRSSAHSGTPFSVINSELTGLAAFNLNTPMLAAVSDPHVLRASCGHAAIFTPCMRLSQFFSTDNQTGFGNVARNSFRGPGYFKIDTSLYKNIALTERLRFTVGATAFNMLNHTNLANPYSDLAFGGPIGLINGAGVDPSSPYGAYGGPTGRVVVLHGRLVF